MTQMSNDPIHGLTPWDVSDVEKMADWLRSEPVAGALSNERSLTTLVSKLKNLDLDRLDMYCVALASGRILSTPIESGGGPYSYENGFHLVKLGVLALSEGIVALDTPAFSESLDAMDFDMGERTGRMDLDHIEEGYVFEDGGRQNCFTDSSLRFARILQREDRPQMALRVLELVNCMSWHASPGDFSIKRIWSVELPVSEVA